MMKNKKVLYGFWVIFCIISIWEILKNSDGKTGPIGYLTLMFFGGGVIVYFILTNNNIDFKIKRIANLIGCLIFVIASYFLLPFHHLFDGTRKYTPEIGWIIGLGGMCFFGFIFFKLILEMLKEHFRK